MTEERTVKLTERLPHEKLRYWADHCNASNMWFQANELANVTGLVKDQGETLLMRSIRKLADEIERYYIPRPRFEDGEPIQWGDKFDSEYRACRLSNFVVGEDGDYYLNDYIEDPDIRLEPGEFVKRNTTKVYDADGVEIKVGDTVWTAYGDEAVITTLYRDMTSIVEVKVGDELADYSPRSLTHERPVFDAEGVRICKGDTVWGTFLGGKYEVSLVKNGLVYLDDGSICFEPTQLTHKEPDSMEKLRDFASEWSHTDNVSNSAAGDFRDAMQEVSDRLTALIERGA